MRQLLRWIVPVLLVTGAVGCKQSYDITTVKVTKPKPVIPPVELPLVSIIASKPEATEAGPMPGAVKISRLKNTKDRITIKYSVHGDATPNADYIPLSGQAVLEAGQDSIEIPVTPVNDGAIEGPERVIVVLSFGSGYKVSSASSARVTIVDDERTQVSISAPDPDATEQGPTTGLIRVSRSGATENSLMVNLTLSGSAVSGQDYVAIVPKIVIPANADHVDIEVKPIDDSIFEGPETVIATLMSEPTRYDLGDIVSATVSIQDNDKPRVRVTATDADASEAGGNNGEFKIEKIGADNTAITVKFAMQGTATNGTDYANVGSSVDIPSGKQYTLVAINPVDDAEYEGDEEAKLVLVASPNDYEIDSPASASVVIHDNDKPTVTVDVIDDSASESGDKGTIRIKRSGITTAALNVYFDANGGSAKNGVDFTQISSPVSIPAGKTYVDLSIVPIDDDILEGNEVARVAVITNPAYNVGNPSSGDVTIYDNEPPSVSIMAANNSAAEENRKPGVFRFIRSYVNAEPVTVKYVITGLAKNGVDYDNGKSPAALIGTSVVIPANVQSVDLAIVPIDDTEYEGQEDVVFTLSESTGYIIDSDNRVGVVFIADNDNDVLKQIKPVLAVRGLQCTMCHAKINSNVVTDFGFGTANFFNKNFGNNDIGHTRLGWNMPYSVASITGQVVVPSASFASSLIDHILKDDNAGKDWRLDVPAGTSITTLPELMSKPWIRNDKSERTVSMDSVITPPNDAQGNPLAKVIGKQSIAIRSPSESDIINLLPESKRNEAVAFQADMVPGAEAFSGLYVENGNASMVNSGEEVPKIVRNHPGQTVVCQGDVIVKGTLYLQNLNLRTGPAGCRIYVSESAFIYGPITSNQPDGKHNVQVTAARAIVMGLGLHRLGVYENPGLNLAEVRKPSHEDDSMICNPWMRLARNLDTEYYPDGQHKAVLDKIAKDARKLGNWLVDATDVSLTNTPPAGTYNSTCDNGTKRLAIDYSGLLLNSQVIQSGYLGVFKGVMVGEIATAPIHHFQFTFDSMFENKTILPRLIKPILEISAQ